MSFFLTLLPIMKQSHGFRWFAEAVISYKKSRFKSKKKKKKQHTFISGRRATWRHKCHLSMAPKHWHIRDVFYLIFTGTVGSLSWLLFHPRSYIDIPQVDMTHQTQSVDCDTRTEKSLLFSCNQRKTPKSPHSLACYWIRWQCQEKKEMCWK